MRETSPDPFSINRRSHENGKSGLAPVAGEVTAIHVQQGDTVNLDECLIEIN